MKDLGLKDSVLNDIGSLRIYLKANGVELHKVVKGFFWGTRTVFQADLLEPVRKVEADIEKKKQEIKVLETKLGNTITYTIDLIKTVEPNVFDGSSLFERLKSKLKPKKDGDSKPKVREVVVGLTQNKKVEQQQQGKGKNNNGQHNGNHWA